MAVVTKQELDKAVKGKTVVTEFRNTVEAGPSDVALRWKNAAGEFEEWTYGDYADKACRIAAGLAGLGVKKGDRVVLMIRNRPEFHIADMGALLVGATPISIYNSSAADQVEYLTSHSEAKVAIVEDIGFYERFLKVRDQLPALETIVLIEDPDGLGGNQVVPFASLLANDPVDFASASQIAQPEDLATVIYTSGTTGPPKGVMLSHYNICWTAESYKHVLVDDLPRGLRCLSYLPMAHIAERMSSHYLGALVGLNVTTCPDPGLLAQYLPVVHPQTFFGVPRVWEKLHAGVSAALAGDPERKQKFDEAVAAGKAIDEVRRTGKELSKEQQETWDFLDAVAFGQVRGLIGLDDVKFALTGAAPIEVGLLEWFRAIGIPLAEIYGMSENTGPMTWDPYEPRIGTVGRAMPGVEVKLLDDGEVVCRGGNVFDGYLKDPEKTAEALNADGWLHTGDIGEMDEDGYLRIVDRKKELIITAGGKNISPANLESALKAFPLIGQAAAIGDNRPFMSALVVLDPEVAPAWAKQKGIEAASLAELAEHPDVVAEIDANVKEANARFSQVEQIKKWKILSDEWLPDSDELTPTSKLKRRGINSRYAQEIEAIYAK